DLFENQFISTATLMPDGKSLLIYPFVPPQLQGERMPRREPALWDTEQQRDVRKFPIGIHGGRADGQPHVVAPDSSAMAEAQVNGDVFVWDGKGNPLYILKPSRQPRTQVVFAFGGKALVAADESHAIRVWDTKSGELTRSFGGGLAKPAAI